MKQEIKFFRPTINDTQKKLIDEVLTGEDPHGSKVNVLEEAMIELTGASYAVATNNSTSAMHLALCAMQLKRGDKVLCSVNSFPALPEVVRHFDAEPVFLDIKEDDFNIDLDALEKYLEAHNSKKLKAVIVGHVGGQPTDLERLYDIAKAYDIKVIEDASESLGATYNGALIGATGADVTIFSFNPHLKETGSEGGIMLCEDEALYERARLLKNHAMVQSDDADLEYIYDVVDIGYKYDISELDAAYCLGALENVSSSIARNQEIAAIYKKRLAGVNHVTLPSEVREHNYGLFIIKIDKNRDSFARDMKNEGIETGLHYIPLHLLSYYKTKYELRVNAYPKALQIFQQVLSIPIYEAMTDEEVHYVCDTIINLAKTRV